jgi:hypothetical protein
MKILTPLTQPLLSCFQINLKKIFRKFPSDKIWIAVKHSIYSPVQKKMKEKRKVREPNKEERKKSDRWYDMKVVRSLVRIRHGTKEQWAELTLTDDVAHALGLHKLGKESQRVTYTHDMSHDTPQLTEES